MKDIDLVIEAYGPTHYRNQTMDLIDSSLYTDRIMKHFNQKVLYVPFEVYKEFYDEHGNDPKEYDENKIEKH